MGMASIFIRDSSFGQFPSFFASFALFCLIHFRSRRQTRHQTAGAVCGADTGNTPMPVMRRPYRAGRENCSLDIVLCTHLKNPLLLLSYCRAMSMRSPVQARRLNCKDSVKRDKRLCPPFRGRHCDRLEDHALLTRYRWQLIHYLRLPRDHSLLSDVDDR